MIDMRGLSKVFLLISLAAISLLTGINSHATVVCTFELFPDHQFFLQGEITSTDAIAIEQCIKKREGKSVPILLINSPGGDVYAAMKIGKLLRENRVSAAVRPPDECLSACPLILAGATSRLAFGKIGIHRPYSLDTGIINFEKAQKKYNKTRSDIESYLREMNIPASFFAAMERIPPEKISYLSTDELKAFGIYDDDPIEQEVQTANQADLRGISKQEYLQRLTEAENLCNSLEDRSSLENFMTSMSNVSTCKSAVSWGLTPSLYLNRYNLEDTACGDTETKYGRESKEYRTCYREVMLGIR